MFYALAAVVAAVVDYAVAVFKPLAFRDFGNLLENFRDISAVFGIYFVCTADMFFRDNDNMNGSLRCDISESVNIFVLINLVRRNFACDYLTENA